MSISSYRNVTCDILDDQPCVGWLDTDEGSAREMRAVGKRLGWKLIGRGGKWIDVCPLHAERMTS